MSTEEIINFWIDRVSRLSDEYTWKNGVIKVLEYSLENQEEVFNNLSLLSDLYLLVELLYHAFYEEEISAFLVLEQKYRPIFSNEEIGRALKEMSFRTSSAMELL